MYFLIINRSICANSIAKLQKISENSSTKKEKSSFHETLHFKHDSISRKITIFAMFLYKTNILIINA
jgi:hypothetical protein